jgi:hypothetical protein
VVSAAAMITRRCAFILGSASEPRVQPISSAAYDPRGLIKRVRTQAGTPL